jgi:osmotically inducible lipoprotein OsmB
MKVITSLLLTASLFMVGCTATQVGTVGGGVGGGYVGSALTGGSTLGTIGGALGGAYVGNRIGQNYSN